MFSGIVEALGTVKRISRTGANAVLAITSESAFRGVVTGESISVNGVCLTVVKNEGGVLYFEAVPQTLAATTLAALKINEKVNIERALKVGDRVSGHFVLGHVDCVGVIRRKGYRGGAVSLEIAVPAEFMKYVLPKGSIAVDGISLTVAEKRSPVFRVSIIPHTLKNTTLSFKGSSDKVNVEFDILAKK
jgi:riboflavin synthase